MPTFIDLQRRFRDLTQKELEDPEFLASLNDHPFGSKVGWPELLKHPRVLLLAEAGAGKTFEMREQVRELVEQDRFAFFVAIEQLDREPLTQILSPADERRFEAWKGDTRAPAWFFLDAVDELKLTEGKLERALSRIARDLDGHVDRARLVFSSRPNDWRPARDLAILKSTLPVPERRANPLPPPDEFFVQALQRETKGTRSRTAGSDEESSSAPGDVRTVILLPLSERQIGMFTERSAVKNTAAFLAEINRQDAWVFARRPLDLSELIATWTTSGHLGTRAKQHESNIATKLRDDPQRADRGTLPGLKARDGAERLALALALTRTRTLRSSERPVDVARAVGALDPGAILGNWTEAEQQVLLRRALFDPATYGRVRFHHRSVQEYLAARRLQHLREQGMPTKAVFGLLFAEQYGVKVVIPSMRPIAAWLALWDDAVRRELTRREPEVLLSFGDPESLTVAARAELIRAFVSAYASGGARGMNLQRDEVRRLAHPELAPVIRELWAQGSTNQDVRDLLIMVIWQGRMEACLDLARAAAFDPTWEEHHRIMAVRALLDCGQLHSGCQVTEAMLSDPASWPDEVIHNVAANLFPSVMSVDELMILVECTPEPKSSSLGFGWALREIAQAVDPASPQATALRDAIAEVIWRKRDAHQEFFRIRGPFGYLAPGLAMLCGRQLATSKPDAALLRCCVIASRFADDEAGSAKESVDELKRAFRDPSETRAKVFWAEIAFMDEVVPAKADSIRLYYAQQGGLTGRLTDADRGWLEFALGNAVQPERRSIALSALLTLWHQRGRIDAEIHVLHEAVKDDFRLRRFLVEGAAVQPVDPETQKTLREAEERRVARTAKEAKRVEDWKQWREELMASPATFFEPERQETTVHNLYEWMQIRPGERARLDIWDWTALRYAFGADVTERSKQALQTLWRITPPVLWSERSPEKRDTAPLTWVKALSGLASEATTAGWAARMTEDEARRAAAYATLELNGFPGFLADLARAHHAAVDAVIGHELSEQLKLGDDNAHLPILQDVTHAERGVKRLLAPRILSALPTVPVVATEQMAARWARRLDQMLRILGDIRSEGDSASIAQLCAERYQADPAGGLARTWLRGLFRFDPVRGTDVLTADLTRPGDAAAATPGAVETFASLFGDSGAIVLEITDPAERVRALGRLVRLAYAFIRPNEDPIHEGVYTPTSRDQAEMARSSVLSALIETPGNDARQLLLELASEREFAGFPDRLRMFARRRAAADAEFVAFDVQALVDLDTRYEIPPADRDGLFRVMMDRLEDLAHDFAHHDFSDRRLVRTIEDELEMQRTLCLRLEAKSNRAFVITREDEVADRKRPDIRLAAVHGGQKAVIEVKLADDRWSVSDLERALRDQLVGQYLRHDNCKAGCLLLTYDGTKTYWQHPDTRERLHFNALLAYLREQAGALELEHRHTIRLAVFGLDLTDPVLVPTHA